MSISWWDSHRLKSSRVVKKLLKSTRLRKNLKISENSEFRPAILPNLQPNLLSFFRSRNQLNQLNWFEWKSRWWWKWTGKLHCNRHFDCNQFDSCCTYFTFTSLTTRLSRLITSESQAVIRRSPPAIIMGAVCLLIIKLPPKRTSVKLVNKLKRVLIFLKIVDFKSSFKFKVEILKFKIWIKLFDEQNQLNQVQIEKSENETKPHRRWN